MKLQVEVFLDMELLAIAISLALSFILGSIPSGYLIVKKFKGIDIRKVGSGNIGSTNVKRGAGKGFSIATQAADVVKGAAAVLVAMGIYKFFDISLDRNFFLAMNAFVAILGHDYTPFLGFNGGKGVNTTLGAFVLIEPIAVFTGVALYFVLAKVTKIVSIRSMSLGVTLFLVTLVKGSPFGSVIFTLLAALLMLYRHEENIKRLIRGEEK